MNNAEHSLGLLKDAESAFYGAELSFKNKDYRTSVMNSQIAVELSSKAVIACFEEPEWTHNPRAQLIRLKNRFGLQNEIVILANNADDLSSWHAKSVYGGKDKEGIWKPAYELCTEEIAKDVLLKAKTSIRIAREFVRKWRSE